MTLDSPVERINNVGDKMAGQLRQAGLYTVRDVLNFFPRTFEDFSGASSINGIKPGNIVIRARVLSAAINRSRRGNTRIITAVLEDNNGDRLKAIWFNQVYRMKQLKPGNEFLFSGKYDFWHNQYQLMSPSMEAVHSLPVVSDKILPVYSIRQGLSITTTRRVMTNLRPLIKMLPETLPKNIVDGLQLMSRSEAVEELHFPSSRDSIERAKYRISFEEVFIVMLAALLNKLDVQRIPGYPMKLEVDKIKQFVDQLPFKLTDSQRKASWEIMLDFQKDLPMNRLLQGDVGSGKTVVAGLTSYQAILAGYQVALMVPTEVLAEQHAATLTKLLEPFNVSVELLTGVIKSSKRKDLMKRIASGEAQLIVGTHALFQPDVEFKHLGYVIIDEQHRFGVKQRKELTIKTGGSHLPHLLSMTATPIPRSLQLTVLGDLSISTLTELPSGRKAIKTIITDPSTKDSMYKTIEEQLQAGHQAYFITRLIEDSETSTKISAEELYKQVSKRFPKYRIGIMHGKLPSEQKDFVMRQFESHELDILVSTTVVEVGVDVPNATVIVISNAEQFGLAQLHQLRGRVGRGHHESFCFLEQSTMDRPTRRLKEVAGSNDGFYLAEVDLRLRGAGEIYGTAQHGEFRMGFANLNDIKLLKVASDTAKAVFNVIEEQPDYLDHFPELKSQVEFNQKLTVLN